MQKFLEGYTQNANGALHLTVWKLCPKELFLGRRAWTFPALSPFPDSMMGHAPFSPYRKGLNSLYTSAGSVGMLRKRDRLCLYKLKYRSSEHGKMLRRKVRKKRKGIQDRDKEGVGPLYVPGRFDCEPGPSSTCKRAI